MAERPRPQLRMPPRTPKRPEPTPSPVEDDIGQSAEEEATEEQDEDKPAEPVVFEQPPAEDDPWAGWQPPEGFTPAAEQPAEQPADPLPPVADDQLGLFDGEQHADPDRPEPAPAPAPAAAPVMSSAGPLSTPHHHHGLHPRTRAEMEAGRAAIAARHGNRG